MGTIKISPYIYLLLLFIPNIQCAVQSLTQVDERPNLYRQARDDRYYQQRYGAGLDRDRDRDRTRRPGIKPDPALPEARGDRDRLIGDRDTDNQQGQGVEKRCIRCTTSYLDPYDYRDYYDRDRYDRYDRYDDRYNNYDRYDSRSYYDRDRWYDRRPAYYDDRWYDYRGYDRYDRGGYDRGGYDRYDRGFGYDNRGYDNRAWRTYDYRGGYRPWDDTARGSSGWDTYGRGGGGGGGGGGGYYNRPDYWGYDRSYATNYNYGRGDSWRDPYRRDPYSSYDGYRGTSYLYERQPTPVTTARPPSKDGEAGGTEHPGDAKPEGDTSSSG